jgi:hypothetical protein
MTYNAEQITYMLADAIDKDREYKSWHVSTKHLMTLVERVVAEEREACAKECWKQMGLLPTQAWSVNPYEQCIDAIRKRGQA